MDKNTDVAIVARAKTRLFSLNFILTLLVAMFLPTVYGLQAGGLYGAGLGALMSCVGTLTLYFYYAYRSMRASYNTQVVISKRYNRRLQAGRAQVKTHQQTVDNLLANIGRLSGDLRDVKSKDDSELVKILKKRIASINSEYHQTVYGDTQEPVRPQVTTLGDVYRATGELKS